MSRNARYALLSLLLFLVLTSGNGGGGILPSTRIIDVEGPAVLVVYESEDLTGYPEGQRDIIRGAKWQDLVPAGNWRVLDDDAPWTGESVFKPAFERPRASLPWAIVSGNRNYEGPLPDSVDAFVKLVEAAR